MTKSVRKHLRLLSPTLGIDIPTMLGQAMESGGFFEIFVARGKGGHS
ncbi:MAG: hypothetical protein ACJAT6_001146 [Akkermansiaceae bacterium]|jgi:hypothetical protein